MSGKLRMFSDQLDDEALEFARHSFFRYADGIAYYRLTEKTITRLAKEVEAIYKIFCLLVNLVQEKQLLQD
ncbi:DUF6462 family protein [Stomatobaculum longum]|jgi:hypothetical protein|uniref:DUF6462 family protein n=1 Tax=Stomatobaculum longum TaxID=796942 RepID=UPI002F40D7A7